MISLNTLKEILSEYNITDELLIIDPYGNGLINNTWKVIKGDSPYILQRINNNVFKKPPDIEYNIHLISEYLKTNHPDYLFVAPVTTINGKEMIKHPKGYFRLFPFIKNSYTVDVATTPQQAFEAARQFGLFTKMLSEFPAASLKTTIPDFHNLVLRARQFKDAGMHGNTERVKNSVKSIQFILDHTDILNKFQAIQTNKNFKLRVTHHDTKISNVLLGENGRGLCVIDLDTVMPGYFISDVGDMMRTYLSPVSEEEKDFSKIEIREDFFRAVVEGYLQEMKTELTETEINYLIYAGKFMIYMQAIRFLTDHLNNDEYYGAVYKDQNYVRANNQITLLQRLLEKEIILKKIVLKN